MLKNQAPKYSPFALQQNMSDEQLWNAFLLTKKANSGDPVAQHELGLRYLFGKDFLPDTVKAAYWIKKAAQKKVLLAQYNYGILLNNGWGIEWDPFEAYRQFKEAATHGLIDAEYVYGLFHTDNLVISRNYAESYRWIKMAADSGYTPAKEVLNEFEKSGVAKRIMTDSEIAKGVNRQNYRTTSATIPKPSLHPIFLDFTADSVSPTDNETLFKESRSLGNNRTENISDSTNFSYADSLKDINTIRSLQNAAFVGSPEALTMLGRMYEQGIAFTKDSIIASYCYLQAMRFDSPRAPMFLWNLIQNPNYFSFLKHRINLGDPTAEVLWAGLIEFGFDHQLTNEQALALLEDAAAKGFPDALVQLGICYYSGHWVKQDRRKSKELFQSAEGMKSSDAQVRLCAIEIEESQNKVESDPCFNILLQAMRDGSVMAEAMIGYCYEKGKSVSVNKSDAIKYYRLAARRGSQIAYNAIKRLYDEIRPKDLEFQIDD